MNLPADLTEYDQWVVWRYENSTKVPYRVDGRRASSTNPTDWNSYAAVVACFERQKRVYSGIGWVFTETDPFTGLDCDDALEDVSGNPKPWCRDLLERFADTYAEVSPSGLGIKLWCRGKLPAAIPKVQVADGGVEAYSSKRFFTCTGQAFRDAPLQIEEHQADLNALYNTYRAKEHAPHYRIPDGGKIPYGIQHLTLLNLCGALRRHNACDAAVEACLQIVNRDQCERPGPTENISRMVVSTRHWRVSGT